MRKIIFVFIAVIVLVSCKSNRPLDLIDEKKISSAISDYLKFETYWSGRWSERGYWTTNASTDLFKKNKIQITYSYNKSSDCYKIFIDELRSVFFLTNKNGFYYVNSSDDTWWKEADTNEFNELKANICKTGCKKITVSLSGEPLNRIAINISDKEKMEKIKTIVKDDILKQKRHSFILGLLKKYGLKKITVKIGINQLSYPGIYYFINGIPFMGSVIYDPESYEILSSDFFYWKELPDNKHYENIHKQIEKNHWTLNL